MPRGRFGAADLVAALACGLALPAAAQGVVIHVDPADPAAVVACVRPTVAVPSPAPCTTIQWALGIAAHHDRIDVAPGVYGESLLIDKRVTLAGAQAGVDGRRRPAIPMVATETIIEGNALTLSGAHAVTVDGLVVRGGPGTGIAVDNAAPTGTYRVLNSILTGNGRHGVHIRTVDADPAPVLLRHNRIGGNDTGAAPHAGVLFDGNVDDAVVEENAFVAGAGPAVAFEGSRPGPPATFQRDITIRGNRIAETGGVLLAGLRDATVAANEIVGSQQAGVLVDGGASAVRIDGNRIDSAAAGGAGVVVRDGAGRYGPNRDVTMSRNSIRGGGHLVRVDPAGYRGPLPVAGNRLIATAGGVHNGAAGVSVDARDNWWGSDAGPGPVNTGAVVADPWLVLGVAPSAGTVAAGGSPVPVTASLGQNSVGQGVALLPVYGGEVAFHTGGVTDSTFVPAATSLLDGRADSVMVPALKAGQVDGDEPLGATLDGQTAAAPTPVHVVAARGPAGATGPTGAPGTPGAQGARGAQGVAGAPGAPGAVGARGAAGPAGAIGGGAPRGSRVRRGRSARRGPPAGPRRWWTPLRRPGRNA